MEQSSESRDTLTYEVNYLKMLVDELENKYRQTEAVLKLITEQYRQVTQAVSDYIFSVYIVDGNPVETVHGPGCQTITGYSPEEFSRNTYLWISMVFEEDRPAVLKHVADILSGKEAIPIEHRIIRKDGVVRWVRNTPVCQYDPQGKLIAYDGLIQDITDRRIAEEQLRHNEEKFRLIAEFTYDWEQWIAPDGHYMYISPSCERITGYPPKAFLDDPDLLVKIVHPEDRDMLIRHFDEEVFNQTDPSHIDFRIITRDGQERWISHNCQPVYGTEGRWYGRRGSNRDITKRKDLESDLIMGHKLEAIGILAKGLAHDFDSLIKSILHDLARAKGLLSQDSEPRSILHEAETTCARAEELVEQLLTFAEAGPSSRGRVHPGNLLDTITTLTLSGAPLRFFMDVPHDLRPIVADEMQIKESIHQMLINAREALPKGGTVTVAARNARLPEDSGVPLPGGEYVVISISDNGPGIAPQDIPKIFDPYFSTKKSVGKRGAGLGLAIARSIVKNHGGEIVVESEPAKGAVFTIYLPAISPVEQKEPAPQPA